MLLLGKPSMACIVVRSRQIVRMKKEKRKYKRKIDCHVMHLKILIKSKRESRRKNVEKMMKNCINPNRFSLARNCSSV